MPEGLAIAGTMNTENLGIERLIRNVLANPQLRFLILCGEDTRQTIGHLPGQSLEALLEGGVDERGRIRGARGKRPIIRNVRNDQVEAFREQMEPVILIGEKREERVMEEIASCASRSPGPFDEAPEESGVETVQAEEPRRAFPDPAGFFIVYPEGRTRRLIVEHYRQDGALDCVLEGRTPAAIYAEAIQRGLLSRLDHAAYLGQELARAERSIDLDEPYPDERQVVDQLRGIPSAWVDAPGTSPPSSPESRTDPGRIKFSRKKPASSFRAARRDLPYTPAGWWLTVRSLFLSRSAISR
jgi:tetrahydromethanopterin S-methyltransferase subunit A